MEQAHGLCEGLVKHRDESQREAERLRTSLRDLERTLGARERAHRHRVKGLEEQVDAVLLLWNNQYMKGIIKLVEEAL